MSTTRFASTKNTEITTVTLMIAGKSTAVIDPIAYWPMPGPAEHHLDHERAAQQVPELDAERGDDRHQRVPERVPREHRPLGEPLGPRRAHVVGADHLQHARPRELDAHARGATATRQVTGMISWTAALAENRPVAGERRVQEVKPGDERRRG